MLEYLEDLIEDDPNEAFPNLGEDTIKLTPDAKVNDWQAKAVKGEEIDFSAGLSEHDKEVLERLKNYSKRKHLRPATEAPPVKQADPLEINEDYTEGADHGGS